MAKTTAKKTTAKKTTAKKRAPKKAEPKVEPKVEEKPAPEPEVEPEVEPEEKPELRLSQLEQVELNLCERDYELSMKEIELVNARIRNLTMDYHQKTASLKDTLRMQQQRSEQMALIRNQKLAQIEGRLRDLDSGFSFKDYLEQDDGLLVPNEDKILELDPTAVGGGDGGDSVTA